MVLEKGKNGESYNIGSENDLPNIELVRSICNLVDRLVKTRVIVLKTLGWYVTDRVMIVGMQ